MRKLILFTIYIFVFHPGISQNLTTITDTLGHQTDSNTIRNDADIVFSKAEVEAGFPGGAPAWIEYLMKSLNPNTPIDNGRKKRGKFQVIVRFIVWKDGTLRDVVAETKFGYGMEEEAIRVIKNGPNWIPAFQNGRRVNAYRRQPITFVVR